MYVFDHEIKEAEGVSQVYSEGDLLYKQVNLHKLYTLCEFRSLGLFSSVEEVTGMLSPVTWRYKEPHTVSLARSNRIRVERAEIS